MADPIGFYNSHYTGGEIDEAVKQIKNKTDAPTGSTIMQRDANGRAQIEEGTTGKEIVNFDQLQAAIKSTYKHTVIIQRTWKYGLERYGILCCIFNQRFKHKLRC